MGCSTSSAPAHLSLQALGVAEGAAGRAGALLRASMGRHWSDGADGLSHHHHLNTLQHGHIPPVAAWFASLQGRLPSHPDHDPTTLHIPPSAWQRELKGADAQ